LEVYQQFPQRFGLIKPFDPDSPGVVEELAEWAAVDGTVGARIVMLEATTPDNQGLNRVLRAGATDNLPINVLCWGRLPLFEALVKNNPDTQLVLDHVGLTQTFEPPPPRQQFADLAQVLVLAAYDNVAIKISGACT